jgi:small subunit ribosomal protein S16
MRLSRAGSKKKPYYHIVIMDSRKRRDGRYIEKIGSYDPIKPEDQVTLNAERVQYWYQKGAQPSETVRSIIRKQGIKLTTK